MSSKSNHLSKRYLFFGLFFLLVSLMPYVLPNEYYTRSILTFFVGFYCLGVLLVSNYATVQITGKSELHRIFGISKTRNTFVLIAVIAGFLLEFLAAYLAGLWYYPLYSVRYHFTIAFFLAGFAGYWLPLLITFLAFKDMLDRFMHRKIYIKKTYRWEKVFYAVLLVFGTSGLLYFFNTVLVKTDYLTSFYLDISNVKEPFISFTDLIICFVSLTAVLEFVEFKRHRTSLLKDIFHGYLNPIYAIILTSVILGLYMELQNVPIKLWAYSNWPLENISIGSIPVLVFLGWIIHYIFFLSLYRALGDRGSNNIWDINKI